MLTRGEVGIQQRGLVPWGSDVYCSVGVQGFKIWGFEGFGVFRALASMVLRFRCWGLRLSCKIYI